MSTPNPTWKERIAYAFKRLLAKNAEELQAIDFEIEDKFTSDEDVLGENFESIRDCIEGIGEEAKVYEIKTAEDYFKTGEQRDKEHDELLKIYGDRRLPYIELIKLAKAEGKLNIRS